MSTARLMAEAQCARSTLYRDVGYMRDVLGAPLEHDTDPVPTWRYVSRDPGGYQLPGMWLSADELYALLLAQQLVQRGSGSGLLGQALGSLQPQLQKLLGDKQAVRLDRLRVLRTQARQSNQTVFRLVTQAVLEARHLQFSYHSRSSARTPSGWSRRNDSPTTVTTGIWTPGMMRPVPSCGLRWIASADRS